MHPNTIATKESQFAKNLKLASGTVLREIERREIDGGFTIRSIRAPAETYYYKAVTLKTAICLHFTVGYILSDIAALTKADSHVSVSYVVDRSGNIYELFDHRYWSYHLGSGAVGGNGAMSKHSIGIEISNYGPLTLSNGKLLDAYGNTYCSESESALYDKCEYRGKSYYASMSPEQTAATAALIKYLCSTNGIPLEFKGDDSPFSSADEATTFKGIFYHTNVRKDKYDWPFGPSVKAVISACTEPDPVPEPIPEPVFEPEPEEPVSEPEHEHSHEQQKPTPVTVQAAAKVTGNPVTNWITGLIQAIMNLFN